MDWVCVAFTVIEGCDPFISAIHGNIDLSGLAEIEIQFRDHFPDNDGLTVFGMVLAYETEERQVGSNPADILTIPGYWDVIAEEVFEEETWNYEPTPHDEFIEPPF